jgi:hypothetical protein
MAIIVEVFSKFALKIDFSKGKSECLLKLRGKGAAKARDRISGKQGMVFALPAPYSHECLRVVEHYKHLGSIVCLSESLVYDAQHRCSSAMTSYAPISGRVFGSRCIPTHLKLHLMKSLVLSRLLFGAQPWMGSVLLAIRKLNAVYMRVLRRIIGDVRFGKCRFSDFQVRETLNQPSIDCLLVRRRLAFLGRSASTQHRSQIACLALRVNGSPLPWIEQVKDDMSRLYQSWPDHCKHLPDPAVDASSWWRFMAERMHEWRAFVSEFTFISSRLDTVSTSAADNNPFACGCCSMAFPSNQALLQHKRRAHGLRLDILCFIDGSGICPVCGVNLVTRLRIVKHLSDSRRCKCRDTILNGGFKPIEADSLRELDLNDRLAKRRAHADGHPSVPAYGQATTRHGKRIGRVQFA